MDNGLLSPFNGCMLGNLTVEQFQARSKIPLTETDISWLKEHRQDMADVKTRDKLHIFDIPFMVHCGSIELASEFAKRMRAYDLSNTPEIQVSY